MTVLSVPTWLSSAELAGLPDLPKNPQHIPSCARRLGWRSRRGRGGRLEYHFDDLPTPAKNALRERCSSERPPSRELLWKSYSLATDSAKGAASNRVEALDRIETLLRDQGLSLRTSVAAVARAIGESE